MENYHLFVVDTKSLEYHIKYSFVGTGYRKENFNIGLWEDIERLKIGDKIIFYVQKVKKFYGIFEVTSNPFFEKNSPPYLQNENELNIKISDTEQIFLNYRALIKGYQVYENGIDEFYLLDILPKKTKNILWSILYRKLKGSRGCTPLFPSEFKTIKKKLLKLNNNIFLNGDQFSFINKKLVEQNHCEKYVGSIERNFDNVNMILNNRFNEHNLHALLLEKLPNKIFGENINWIGNEIYSGAGMQAIDVLTINNDNIFSIIEVKKVKISLEIIIQITKYISWIKGRFDMKKDSELKIQPIIIGEKLSSKQKKNRQNLFINFNNLNISLPIKYFEYEISSKNIVFNEINMLSNDFESKNCFVI